MADANAKKYRTPEEIERYKTQHDPIQIWRRHLEADGLITEADYDEIDRQAREEANHAAEFAEQSPFPSEADLQKDVYYEVDHQTEAAKQGTYFFNT